MANTQLDKRYGSDWAKAKSRDLLKDMIARTLLKFRKPKDLKVLCFPGIDAAEVLQVYDALGIPRENVTGLERNPEVAETLDKRGINGKPLGIKLVNRSLEDYVANAINLGGRFNFDVVSLDYTGPLSINQINDLADLSERQIPNHFVLHHANLIKRDSQSKWMYVVGEGFNNDYLNEEYGGEIDDQNVLLKTANAMIGAQSKIEEGGSKDAKGRGYLKMVSGAVLGSADECIDKLLKFSCGQAYEKVLVEIENTIRPLTRNRYEEKGLEFSLDREHPYGSLPFSIRGNPVIIRAFELVTLQYLKQQLAEALKDKFKPDIANNITMKVYAALNNVNKVKRHFRPKAIKTYSYVSESGSPMIGDIYFLSYPERLVSASERLANSLGLASGRFSFRNKGEFVDALDEYEKQASKFLPWELENKLYEDSNNRTFLGSSARPVLTKQKAIEEFKAGATVEDIKAKYRGYADKPLAQWKAHVTMGTYDKKPLRVEDELVEHEEDSDLEKITKEEAIDLLSSGIPIDEIRATYPTSFTIGQLRAYKAHISMGTYKTDKKNPNHDP